MARNQQNNIAVDRVKIINSILKDIAKRDVCKSESGFLSGKNAIRKLFDLTCGDTKQDILLRLTVIDSMYSTQMNRRYYGLEELAEALFTIQNSTKKSLPDLFMEYLKTKDASLFNYVDTSSGKKEVKNLLSEKYGIGKDGSDKGVAISLISKYAYFATNYEFPIFDSIACEMYPKIWRYCNLSGKPKNPIMHVEGSSVMDGSATLKNYIVELERFVDGLGGSIKYDHLDRLLWFVGKIFRGNLSLVLTREEYIWCANKLNQCIVDGKFEFDIKKVELKELTFLKKRDVLTSFFELAKALQQVK